MGSIRGIVSRVALNASTVGFVLPIDFVAGVVLEVLMNEVDAADDATEYARLLHVVRQVNVDFEGHSYSKEASLTVVSAMHLHDLTLADLMEMVPPTQYFTYPSSLDGSMSFRSVSQNPPPLYDGYGNEEYAGTENFRTFWNRIRRANEDKRYYWQWRLSLEDYGRLREFLCGLDLNGSTRDEVLRYTDQICLFCAEWYKREYTGRNQGNLPAFVAIGCESHQNLSRDLVDRNGRVLLRGNDRYLHSLYIQGGLPFMYFIMRRNANLARVVARLFRQDEYAVAELQDAARDLHNAAVRESLCEKGSVYENIYAILEDETYREYILQQYPGHEDQVDSFIRQLEEETVRLCDLQWRLERNQDGARVVALVKTDRLIKASFLDRNGVSSHDCLQFNLSVTPDQGEPKRFLYIKTGEGDYVPWDSRYDVRVVAGYDRESDIPSSFAVAIENVPGPFGIHVENGFRNGDSIEIQELKCRESILRFYGSRSDRMMYDSSKEGESYVLEREGYRLLSEGARTWRLGNFVFYAVGQLLRVAIPSGRGEHIKEFTPRGTLRMIVSSENLRNILVELETEVHMGTGEIVPSVRFINHEALRQAKAQFNDMELIDGVQFSYYDSEDNLIDDINNYYGYVTVEVSYAGKSDRENFYLIEARRDLSEQKIIVNGIEYSCPFEERTAENSMPVECGDDRVGRACCHVWYPYDGTDYILNYCGRRVWRSPRFYLEYKGLYTRRHFSKTGCIESLAEIPQYDRRRNLEINRVPHGGNNVYRLVPVPPDEGRGLRFYCYHRQNGDLVPLTPESRGRECILEIPFDNTNYDYIVFQSLSDTDTGYRRESNVPVTFNARWWGIMVEHKLLFADYINCVDDLLDAIIGYYEYAGNDPDYSLLKSMFVSLAYPSLLLPKGKLRESLGREELMRMLKATALNDSPSALKMIEHCLDRFRGINPGGDKILKYYFGRGTLSPHFNEYEERMSIHDRLTRDATYERIIQRLNIG